MIKSNTPYNTCTRKFYLRESNSAFRWCHAEGWNIQLFRSAASFAD